MKGSRRESLLELSSVSKGTHLMALLVLALAALALSIGPQSIEARYLPTRADDTDTEILKDLIRGILEEAGLEQLEARAMRMQQSHKSGLHYQQQPSSVGLFKPDRRSLETASSSSGDNLLLRQIGSTGFRSAA